MPFILYPWLFKYSTVSTVAFIVPNPASAINNIGKFNSDISEKGLEEIKPLEMLELCFDENNIPKEQREILIPLYNEILTRAEDENYWYKA